MTEPVNASTIQGYHAHVYYRNDAERAEAAVLRSQIMSGFAVTPGRWRDQPVGPHPLPMYQMAFAVDAFPLIVPWLMLNRRGLSILVHPETDDVVADHDIHPVWLGERLVLNIDFLREAVGQTMRA